MAKRRTAPTTRLLPGPVTAEDVARAYEQMQRIQIGFFAALGLSRAARLKLFRAAEARYPRQPYRLEEADAYATIVAVSEIITLWYADPQFLDEGGAPRSLPLSGPSSFATLTARCLPDAAPATLATQLVREGVLLRRPDGHVRPRRRAVLVRRMNGILLSRLPALLHGLLSTQRHNTRATRRGAHVERTVVTYHLPEEFIDEMTAQIRDATEAYHFRLDAALTRRRLELGAEPSRRTARIQVTTFASVERNRATNARKRPARKPPR
jgi:hypothetical protein